METTRISQINIHGATPTDVSVSITDHEWFAVVEIRIGNTDFSLFCVSIHDAIAIAKNLGKYTITSVQDLDDTAVVA